MLRSEPDELPLLLEEAGERGVVHLHRLQPELRLERRCRLRSRAELAYGARPVELRATPLEPEQRQDRVRPGLGRGGHAGIERVGGVDLALELRS